MNHKDQIANRSTSDGVPETDPRIEALFVQARGCPPPSAQLCQMLRAVPGKRPWVGRAWRIGGAALATAAAVAGAVLLLPAHTAPAFALSQVADAMRAAEVLQRICDDGSKSWENRGRFRACRDSAHGKYSFQDYVRQTMATYQEARGCIIVSSCERVRVAENLANPQTLDDLVSNAESWARSFENEWERTDRMENGRLIVELRAKRPRAYQRAVTIDGVTGRILSMDTVDGRSEYVYDPSPVPANLYDLGVPRDARLIDGTAPQAVLELREKVRQTQRQDLGAYRLVWVGLGGVLQSRTITDGVRVRVDGFGADREYLTTVEEVRAAARTLDNTDPLGGGVRSVAILAGRSAHEFNLDGQGRVLFHHVSPGDFSALRAALLPTGRFDNGDPEGFYGLWGDWQCEAVGPNEHGWVGYRSRAQANQCARPKCRERWFDPAHGYVQCFTWWYDDPHAEWQITPGWQKEYEVYRGGPIRTPADAPPSGGACQVLEWAELRPGQWYPALKRSWSLKPADDGTWRSFDPPADDAEVRYEVLIATPLDSVDDAWFAIPPEWLAAPQPR